MFFEVTIYFLKQKNPDSLTEISFLNFCAFRILWNGIKSRMLDIPAPNFGASKYPPRPNLLFSKQNQHIRIPN
jgi:hypothetical protein